MHLWLSNQFIPLDVLFINRRQLFWFFSCKGCLYGVGTCGIRFIRKQPGESKVADSWEIHAVCARSTMVPNLYNYLTYSFSQLEPFHDLIQRSEIFQHLFYKSLKQYFFLNFNKFLFCLDYVFSLNISTKDSFSVYLCCLIFYETVPSLTIFGHLVVFDSNVLLDTHNV